MHEVGLVEEAIRKATAVMEAAGASSIESLTFAIAYGGHVTPEAVETLFSALSAGTPAEGARLEFENVQAECSCWGCGHDFTSDEEMPTCPNCQGACVSRLATPDLLLRCVDVLQAIGDVHAGHSARTQHVHDELVRAARRRSSFRLR